MKIAVNKCYGGFSVNDKVALLLKNKGVNVIFKGEYYKDGSGPKDAVDHYFCNEDFGIIDDNYDKWRSDERLIEAIEEVGCENAADKFTNIVIKDIPDDVDWEISNYDGYETINEIINEVHRCW